MEILKYEQSGIDSKILRAVEEMGFENMTPIQAQAIPILLEGRDVIGQAQTGTGKTAAFGIPLIQNINPDNRHLQAVVLCPTRELAIQAAEEMRRFAKFMHGVKILPIYGGQEIAKQIRALKGGVQIIVGTPGRVMDHMRRHTLKMNDVKMVVLDEADEMLNMGFKEDMETILKEIPQDHQTALFSATMPKAILDITDTYQRDAVMVQMVKKELTIPLVKQYYYVVRNQDKEEVLGRLLEYYGLERSLVFCNTKKMVDQLTESLKEKGYSAEGLHGDLSQNQRDAVMNRFRNGGLDILIATDMAARGINVDEVKAVFNYDVPQDIEYYVHRIGRTGRAGKEGQSFTFVSRREMYKIREIERVCKTKIEERRIPSAAEITSIKAEKILNKALEVIKNEDIGKLEDVIENRLLQEEYSVLQLAAAFLKLHMGEEIPDTIVCEPEMGRRVRKERDRAGRGKDRQDSKKRKNDLNDRKRNGDRHEQGSKGWNGDKNQKKGNSWNKDDRNIQNHRSAGSKKNVENRSKGKRKDKVKRCS